MSKRIISVAIVLALVFGSSAFAAKTDRDITNTDRGRRLAEETAERHSKKLGVPKNASDYKVTELKDGSLMVAPKHVEVTFTEEVSPYGKKRLIARTTTPSQNDMVAHDGVSSLAVTTFDASEPSEQPIAGECMARHYVGGGWMDTCYNVYYLAKNILSGGTYKDRYGLQMWATGEAYDGYDLETMYVKSYANYEGAIQSWANWDPKSDSTGACTTYERTLSGTYSGQSCRCSDFLPPTCSR